MGCAAGTGASEVVTAGSRVSLLVLEEGSPL